MLFGSQIGASPVLPVPVPFPTLRLVPVGRGPCFSVGQRVARRVPVIFSSLSFLIYRLGDCARDARNCAEDTRSSPPALHVPQIFFAPVTLLLVPMGVWGLLSGGVGVVCAGEQARSSATFSFLTARRRQRRRGRAGGWTLLAYRQEAVGGVFYGTIVSAWLYVWVWEWRGPDVGQLGIYPARLRPGRAVRSSFCAQSSFYTSSSPIWPTPPQFPFLSPAPRYSRLATRRSRTGRPQ
jgi:predicted small integral membrane protein